MHRWEIVRRSDGNDPSAVGATDPHHDGSGQRSDVVDAQTGTRERYGLSQGVVEAVHALLAMADKAASVDCRNLNKVDERLGCGRLFVHRRAIRQHERPAPTQQHERAFGCLRPLNSGAPRAHPCHRGHAGSPGNLRPQAWDGRDGWLLLLAARGDGWRSHQREDQTVSPHVHAARVDPVRSLGLSRRRRNRKGRGRRRRCGGRVGSGEATRKQGQEDNRPEGNPVIAEGRKTRSR